MVSPMLLFSNIDIKDSRIQPIAVGIVQALYAKLKIFRWQWISVICFDGINT